MVILPRNPTNTGGTYGKENKISHGQKIQHQVSSETRLYGFANEKPNCGRSEIDDTTDSHNSQASGSGALEEED